MKKEDLNKLWALYREFCNACNQGGMTPFAPEFLAWLEKFKIKS